MSTSSQMRRSEVGEVRPSQTLTTYGVGSLVDLPNLSVLVMGLDDWPIAHSNEIAEERLLLSAQVDSGTASHPVLDTATCTRFSGAANELVRRVSADRRSGGALSTLDGLFSLPLAGSAEVGAI